MPVIERIGDIYRRIAHAAMRSGREPDDVKLVAVTKTMPAEAVREAVEAGLRAFGESKVQEARAKAAELRGLNIEWHMVGHLQRNKARQAVEIFELIHSVDSVELLELINRAAALAGKVQRVLVQLNLSGEESKSGAREADLAGFLDAAFGMENVIVEGLMTIPPYSEDPGASRPIYRRLRELAQASGLAELSMGMTGDFEVAIEEGATIVRVGTAIFGERVRA
ncbi:MAG: YggS family pyridoxal phosphate-dependent enzyme [Thermodesulfovibrionales bacterium]